MARPVRIRCGTCGPQGRVCLCTPRHPMPGPHEARRAAPRPLPLPVPDAPDARPVRRRR